MSKQSRQSTCLIIGAGLIWISAQAPIQVQAAPSPPTPPRATQKKLSILIDPGHGGEDLGAHNQMLRVLDPQTKKLKMIYEKHLTLKLAQKLAQKLKNKYRVYLTRSVDRFLSLPERAKLADKVDADIFISIHANASERAKSQGFETYYLSNHRDAAVKKVEAQENVVPPGTDPMVQKILIDLVIERTAERSKQLARHIHQGVARQVASPFKMVDRGIRPGVFYVLALSKRPAVLLEAGFLSNPRELQKMVRPDFQKRYIDGIVKGLERYQRERNRLHLGKGPRRLSKNQRQQLRQKQGQKGRSRRKKRRPKNRTTHLKRH